ncbi:MAG: peptide/nickel transport system ATP-binding protein [Halobacteriales archaeon]|jgi:peptide/nickel transport system ATP-binding protein
MTEDPVLTVRDLEKHYTDRSGLFRRSVTRTRAVDGVSFDLQRGETLGLVGESGCGKSTLGTTLTHLEEPTGGTVRFAGESFEGLSSGEKKRFRRQVQMVFQDPNEAFNPRMTVKEAVEEPLRIHGLNDADRREEVVYGMLDRVGLSREDVDRYPHEFSGGQKQRIALARALVLNPQVLIADEPVSALDVSVKADILSLLAELRDSFDLSMLIISHDLSVVRQLSDRVAVMYLGEIVETAPTEQLFEDPRHPYTEALISAIQTPDPTADHDTVELSGTVPDPANPPAGCRFHTRCPAVIPPKEFDLPGAVWRSLLDFRLALADGEIPDSSGAGMDETVRGTYGLPDPIPDENVEAILSEALAVLAEGAAPEEKIDSAESILSDQFTTVCRRSAPEDVTLEDDRRVKCHLEDTETRQERKRKAETEGQMKPNLDD